MKVLSLPDEKTLKPLQKSIYSWDLREISCCSHATSQISIWKVSIDHLQVKSLFQEAFLQLNKGNEMFYEERAGPQAVSVQYITERQYPWSTVVALEVTENMELF